MSSQVLPGIQKLKKNEPAPIQAVGPGIGSATVQAQGWTQVAPTLRYGGVARRAGRISAEEWAWFEGTVRGFREAERVGRAPAAKIAPGFMEQVRLHLKDQEEAITDGEE